MTDQQMECMNTLAKELSHAYGGAMTLPESHHARIAYLKAQALLKEARAAIEKATK